MCMKKQKVVKLTTIGKMVVKSIELSLIKRPVSSVSLIMLCICVLLWKTGILDKGSVVLTWISLTLSGSLLLFMCLLFRPDDKKMSV